MEEREWLKAQLKEIEKWEKDDKRYGFGRNLAGFHFKSLDKLTPAFIQKKIGVLLDEMGHYIQSGGVYLTSEKGIIHQFQKKCADESISRIEDIEAAPIEVMDAISDQMGKNRTNLATVQGATTGVGGMFTLAADIPAVLGLSLKTLQDIAVTYGYDPKNKEERVFIIKCLQLNSADVVGKKSILKELKSYHASEGKHENMISQIQGWREVVYNYRDSFGRKKLFQLVPIAGILFGAASNRSQLKGIAETGIMQYRKRRILSRLEELAQQEQRDSGA